MKRLLFALTIIAVACATLPIPKSAIPVVYAQSLPLTVKLAVDPDASAMGYTVQLDQSAAVDVGLPASTTCANFVGGATSACVPFSVSINTLGSHTVKVVAYNLGGSSPAATITFNVAAPPGNPGNARVTK